MEGEQPPDPPQTKDPQDGEDPEHPASQDPDAGSPAEDAPAEDAPADEASARPVDEPPKPPPPTPPTPPGGSGPLMRLAARMAHGWRKTENGVVISVFAIMALLSCAEVLGRKLFNTGITGAQVYVQHLTMWAGFLGAMLATREGKHLGLSTSELLPARVRPWAHASSGAVTAFITAVLASASLNLVLALRGSGSTLGGNVPEWVSVAVMPSALLVMAVRTAFNASPRWRGRAPALALVLVVVVWRMLLPADMEFLEDTEDPNGATRLLMWLMEVAPKLSVPGTVLILVGVMLGVPVYAGMSGLAMLWFFAVDTPIASVPAETYRLVASPTLPAIPILTGAGFILAVGGSSKRLVMLFRSMVGWLPGGMALMVIAVCAIFTTLTGGSGVTILALGGLVYPILREEKYAENFSLGTVTASGSLGLLFFPSVPVILYAVVSQQPIERLFVAGFLPGMLMILFVAAYAVFMGVRHKVPRHPFSLTQMKEGTLGAKFDLVLPLIVLVSFGSGLATMVEAAALAFVYAIIVECGLERTLSFRKGLPRGLVEAGTLVGSVLMVLSMAMGLTSYMVDEGIPGLVIQWVKANIESPTLFLLILNGLLLVLGSVLEIFSAIVILAPLLAPLGVAYGIDPLHLGIIFLANLELGFLFPPVGLNLFLSSTRFQKPLPQLYRAAFPFLVIMGLSVMVITYVPSLSTGVYKWWEARNAPTMVQPAGAPLPDSLPPLPEEPDPADDEPAAPEGASTGASGSTASGSDSGGTTGAASGQAAPDSASAGSSGAGPP